MNNISDIKSIPKMTLNVYKNQKAHTHLRTEDITFNQLVQYLRHTVVSSDKFSNTTYLIAKMKDAQRNDDNVIERHAICIDVDDLPADTTIVDDIKNMFGFSYIIYSTHNHVPTAPRYRLIIPLSKPISKEWYKPAINFFEDQLQIKADENAYDWSRCMARTVLKSEKSEFIFEYQETYPLDTDKLINGLDAYKDAETTDFTLGTTYKRKDDSHWDIAYGQISEGAGRNSACTSLVGLLLRRYVPLKVTVALIEHWNMSNQPPLSNDELTTIINSIVKTETIRRGERVT
ncbi:primase alpha helix C-terminal domain-containing protein [Macrococcoides goetzii]|uniref:primase alpha helix C-terminal domain-containing protein n=1 Tax=Macrococcus sp. PK TaxID=2801919 RepID=UPI001F0E8605|nr:primase alpha helix C-terminal domain-containing protein [Macrococcus sp. PK]MCH4984913.1 primase alpha helix C-terminal domain-containing protein [Macrococcus sp. PK]